MSEPCEFDQEGFCVLDVYDEEGYCPYREDSIGLCMAKPDDLIDVCPDCFKPMDDCECEEASITGIKGKE